MKTVAFLTLLALAACGSTNTLGTWQDCAAWPSAGAGGVPNTKRLLELAREGKEAHGDCQARYNALRAAAGVE